MLSAKKHTPQPSGRNKNLIEANKKINTNGATNFRMWLDLSRVGDELFRLKQGQDYYLSIPAEWKAENANVYLESDQFSTSREISLVNWTKAPSKWSSLADFYVQFRPNRNGSYRFEVRIGEKIVHDGYITTVPELSETSPINSVDSIVVQTIVPKECVVPVFTGSRLSTSHSFAS